MCAAVRDNAEPLRWTDSLRQIILGAPPTIWSDEPRKLFHRCELNGLAHYETSSSQVWLGGKPISAPFGGHGSSTFAKRVQIAGLTAFAVGLLHDIGKLMLGSIEGSA